MDAPGVIGVDKARQYSPESPDIRRAVASRLEGTRQTTAQRQLTSQRGATPEIAEELISLVGRRPGSVHPPEIIF